MSWTRAKIVTAVLSLASSLIADDKPPAPAKDPITAEMRQALGRINKVHGEMDPKDIDEAVETLHREIARHDPQVFVPLAIPYLMRLAPRDTQTRALLRRALANGWLEEESARACLVKAGDAAGPHIEALIKALDDAVPKVRMRAAGALGGTGAAGVAALPKLREIVAKAKADPSDYRREYTPSVPMPEHVVAYYAILRIESGLGGRWQMTLPAGFKYEVTLRSSGEGHFFLQSAGRFAGEYELQDGRLVMAKPADAAEKGFEWEVRGPDVITLVAQRPGLEVNYVGTTLKRMKDDAAEKPLKDDGGGRGPKPKRQPADVPVPKTSAVSWNPAGIEGSFMFKDATEFRSYLAGAEVIAAGTLTGWDGSQGTLKVQKLYRGKGQPDRLSLSYTGGTVAAKAGEKVLVLLTADKGAELHSYCAAPGLFRYSDDLASHVQRALERPAAPADGISEDEAKSARALQRIKAEHRLRKEPVYQAPVQYCLLLLGRDAKTRPWLASDGTTLYVDKNGNGDLTEPEDAVPFKDGFAALMADAFPGHGGDDKHTHLHVAVRQRDWEKNTGGYWAVRADVGRTFHMYAFVHKFAQKPQDAPVVHLGGPLRMGLNQLEGGALVPGRPAELEAFVACHYPGVEKAFVDVDQRCPADVHPMAEVVLPAAGGAEPMTLRVKLTKRC